MMRFVVQHKRKRVLAFEEVPPQDILVSKFVVLIVRWVSFLLPFYSN